MYIPVYFYLILTLSLLIVLVLSIIYKKIYRLIIYT